MNQARKNSTPGSWSTSKRNWSTGPEPSIPGVWGNRDEFVEFSPPPITPENRDVNLTLVKSAADPAAHPALDVLAQSASTACERTRLKVAEATAEHDHQADQWESNYRAPIIDELQKLIKEKVQLIGQAANCRLVAASEAAKKGLRFVTDDFSSVEACQHAIEQTVKSASVVRGARRTASMKAEVPGWLKMISSISVILLCIMTALGLMEIFGIAIQAALQSPVFVLVLALSLGITLPTMEAALRLGFLIGALGEDKSNPLPSQKSVAGTVFMTAIVIAAGFILGAVDSLGVQAMAQDVAAANARAQEAGPNSVLLPLIGFSFCGIATLMKIASGYFSALETYQDEQIMAIQRSDSDKLRLDCADILALLAEADLADARLVDMQPRIEELTVELGAMVFTADIPEELIEAIAFETESWTGESNRFWAMAWASIPDPTVRHTQFRSQGPSRKSLWSRILGWFRP